MQPKPAVPRAVHLSPSTIPKDAVPSAPAAAIAPERVVIVIDTAAPWVLFFVAYCTYLSRAGAASHAARAAAQRSTERRRRRKLSRPRHRPTAQPARESP